MKHSRRFYRDYGKSRGVCFNVKLDTTDLFITAGSDLSDLAYSILVKTRGELEEHIRDHPDFLYSLVPLPIPERAPDIAVEMYNAAAASGVGPMASVAGAIAEKTGRELAKYSEEVIVENGGDIWMTLTSPAAIGIYVKSLYFSDRLRLNIKPADTPCSLCTSAANLGHSLSFGKADGATVIAESGALADAAATGACNIVRGEDNLADAVDYAMSIDGVKGCMIIYRDRLAAGGSIELC